MDRLKWWNSKATASNTFTNFKMNIRQEYLDLQDIGGLTINNTMFNQANIFQELKDHQVLMSNNLKQEFNKNLMHTFQAFSLIETNANNLQYQPDKENVTQNTEQEQLMLAMKSHRDPILEQLLKHMSMMQTQIQCLTNDTEANEDRTRKKQFSPSDPINPKTGQWGETLLLVV